MSEIEFQVKRNGFSDSELSIINGKVSSLNDGPAMITNDFSILRWYKGGVIHREERLGPAEIDRATSRRRHIKWFKLGKMSREGGPAYITIDNNVITANWLINGKMHRVLAPASIRFKANKTSLSKEEKTIKDELFYHLGFNRTEITSKRMYDRVNLDNRWWLEGNEYMTLSDYLHDVRQYLETEEQKKKFVELKLLCD